MKLFHNIVHCHLIANEIIFLKFYADLQSCGWPNYMTQGGFSAATYTEVKTLQYLYISSLFSVYRVIVLTLAGYQPISNAQFDLIW